MKDVTERLAVLQTKVEAIEKTAIRIESQQKDFFKEIKDNYVHQKEFEPVKKAVYSVVATIVAGVSVAIFKFIGWR